VPKESFDLAEATELVKHDFQSSFLPFLHDWELFEYDPAARLAALQNKIEGYDARPPRELPIPKSSLLSRPGALPIAEDWILYTAVTAAIARQVEKNLIPPDQEVLFSSRWNEADAVRMVKAKASGYGDSEYLARFASWEKVQQRIHRFILSAECIYDWQAMHLIGAMLSAAAARPDIVALCFDLARNRNRDIGLRSVCIDLVARHGTEDQVRELSRSFTKEACEEVRAAIVLASRRLQQVERRAFLGACRGFSPALDAAVAKSWSGQIAS